MGYLFIINQIGCKKIILLLSEKTAMSFFFSFFLFLRMKKTTMSMHVSCEMYKRFSNRHQPFINLFEG